MQTAPLVLLAALVFASARGDDLDGVKVSFEEGSGTLAAERLGPFRLLISATPSSDEARVLRIELPETGPKTWPAADVRITDSAGVPLPVRRSGIEWAKLSVPLPRGASAVVVEAIEPGGGWTPRTSRRDRLIEDASSGASIRIAEWPGGKRAALSLRFDDSGPSHLDKVDPILREYGFRGTFMVNPGEDEPGSRRRSAFQARLADWKALAERGDHEFANHTAHHRGAANDEEMDVQIRLAAEVIWRLAPRQGKLTALNLGGGTSWTTTRTLRHYLETYHQFESSGSLGMDDVYGGRVEAFRKHLESHLERGLWARVHYHGVGEGEGASEANFRAALKIAKEHRDRFWIAGMAEIHRYQTARDGSRLALIEGDGKGLEFRVETTTNPALYDRPLEIEVHLPQAWRGARLESEEGAAFATTAPPTETGSPIRFEVPPRTAAYRLISLP